jgi:hypothetical protein
MASSQRLFEILPSGWWMGRRSGDPYGRDAGDGETGTRRPGAGALGLSLSPCRAPPQGLASQENDGKSSLVIGRLSLPFPNSFL